MSIEPRPLPPRAAGAVPVRPPVPMEVPARTAGAGGLSRAAILALVFLCAWVGAAAAQGATWESHNAAGLEAFQQGDFPEAARRFESALSLAAGETTSDQQLGTLMYSLAAAHLASARYDEVRRTAERWADLLSAYSDEPWVAEQQAARSALLAVMERLQLGPGDSRAGDQAAEELYAIHLVSVRSEPDARAEWKRLNRLYPEILGPRSLLTKEVHLSGQGTFIRVLAGSFRGRVTARYLCKYFERNGQYCAVVRVEAAG